MTQLDLNLEGLTFEERRDTLLGKAWKAKRLNEWSSKPMGGLPSLRGGARRGISVEEKAYQLAGYMQQNPGKTRAQICTDLNLYSDDLLERLAWMDDHGWIVVDGSQPEKLYVKRGV